MSDKQVMVYLFTPRPRVCPWGRWPAAAGDPGRLRSGSAECGVLCAAAGETEWWIYGQSSISSHLYAKIEWCLCNWTSEMWWNRVNWVNWVNCEGGCDGVIEPVGCDCVTFIYFLFWFLFLLPWNPRVQVQGRKINVCQHGSTGQPMRGIGVGGRDWKLWCDTWLNWYRHNHSRNQFRQGIWHRMFLKWLRISGLASGLW